MAMTTRFSDDKYIDANSQRINPSTLDIKGVIGEGSFGKVYLGTWNNMCVAVKSMKLDYADDDANDDAYSSFLTEICISRDLTKLNAPNVVKFFGFVMGSDNVVSSLVMENIPYSLDDLLSREHSLSNEIKYEILRQITGGVDWLHKNDYVHRDLKPGNILLDQNYKAKLCDFGSARNINDNNIPDHIIGSPRWLAPELIISILTSQSYSEKAADVWSLCTTYWQIYTSVLPFNHIDDNVEVMRAISQGATEDVSRVSDPKVAHLITTYGWIAADRRATAKELLAKLNEPDIQNNFSHRSC